MIFIGEMRDLETVDRVVDGYPREGQHQARLSLANSLKGIVCQRLASRATGHGRIAVVEVLVMTTRTFDQHLLELYRSGEVSLRDEGLAS